jgi:hypothetical protein
MKKKIFLNYYDEKNLARKKEYLFCIQKNLNLNFISEIYIFLNKDINKKEILNLKNSQKITFIHVVDRVNFDDIIKFCIKNFNEKCIIIISNLDIFLDQSNEWENIDKDFFAIGTKEKSLVCSRHNFEEHKLPDETLYFEKLSWDRGDFSDVWVFEYPFNNIFLKENFNFSVGNAPGCDGLMMGLMNKYYSTFAWGKKYKIYHYDICRKDSSNKAKLNFYISSKISGKRVSFILNDRADINPTLRMNEWYRIPNNQNWEKILYEKSNGVAYKSRLNSNYKIKNKLSLIYHILLFKLSQTIYKINKIL